MVRLVGAVIESVVIEIIGSPPIHDYSNNTAYYSNHKYFERFFFTKVHHLYIAYIINYNVNIIKNLINVP